MRKWKDRETIKIKYRKLLTVGASFIIFMSVLNLLFFHHTWQDWFNIGLGSFVIWGIWMNGFYRIMRYLTEQYIRTKDNKFDYFKK